LNHFFKKIKKINKKAETPQQIPKGTFKTEQKFETYISFSESAKEESKLVHKYFEKKIKLTTLNSSSSFDSIEQEIAESGIYFFFFFFFFFFFVIKLF